MTEFGIHECPPFPSNMMQWLHWEDRAIAAVKNFFAFWRSRRRVLIYCRQGANRSAAMVCLVMSAACGRTAREALIATRPARVDHKRGSPTVHAHLKNSNKLKTNSRRIQGKLKRTQNEIKTNSRQTQDTLKNHSRRIRGELETNSERSQDKLEKTQDKLKSKTFTRAHAHTKIHPASVEGNPCVAPGWARPAHHWI